MKTFDSRRPVKVARRAGWELRQWTRGAPKLVTIHDGSSGWLRVVDEPSVIEPDQGYVITARGALIQSSLEPNLDHKATWRLGLPSPLYREGPAVAHYDTVISLRHRWEWNYYHFLIDVLGKLELIDGHASSLGVDTTTPLILGRYVDQLPFAAHLVARLGRPVVTPGIDNARTVRARRVIFARTRRPLGARVVHLLDGLGVPPARPSSADRIYLTRRPPATRCARNEPEICKVLSRYGFRRIDTAPMTVDAQIEVFAGARHVVALHGAGTTNIIWRRGAPLSLLELHGSTYSGPGNMARLCHDLGFEHNALAGPPGFGEPIHAHFTVDPTALAAAVEKMIDRD